MRKGTVLSLISMVMILGGCDENQDASALLVSDSISAASLEQRIMEMIGVPRCTDVSECAAIAFGSKSCGGPRTYLVYSRTVTDSEELRDAVEMYNKLEAEFNNEHGIVSDCEYVSAPGLACTDGVCQAIR